MNLETLLEPISATAPCGPDLREQPGATPLTEAREHRRQEDESRIGAEAKTADWEAVVRTASSGIARVSKDLELAAYLIEGLTRTEGFSGLARGLQALAGLVERYWDHLHPGLDDGTIDVEMRVAAVERSGGPGVVAAVRSVPLTGAMGNDRPLSMADFEEAERVEDAARTRPATHKEMLERGSPTMQKWQQALAATPPAQVEASVAAMNGALTTLAALEAKVRELVPSDPPSFAALRNLLERTQRVLDGAVAASGPAGPAAAQFGQPGAPTPAGAAGGPIDSRHAAVARLAEIAAYLRASEPHSPVSYLIQRCVRWLNMPYEELMRDLVKTPEVLRSVRETLGLENEG